jgi:colanic acid/amylovoran biosynthesis glycosyltransferase
MNVLYVLRGYPKLSQSFILNEIYGLEERGHNVAVFARRDPGEDITHEEFADLDVPVHYAKRPGLTDLPELCSPRVLNRSVLAQCCYPASPTDHAGYLHLTRQCVEFVESLDWEPDHIHSHFASRGKVVAAYVAAYFGISSSITAHAAGIFVNTEPRSLEVLFDRMDRVVVPSDYTRTYLRDLLDSPTPIDVVPATTRVSKFHPTSSAVPGRVLSVARLVEQKGHVFVIDAVADLVETHPDIEYHIVGSGEREQLLRERVNESGIEDNVAFLGNVTDDRLHRELDEASVFALPCVIAADNNRDVAPVAMKEAMAMETPCVSTTTGAVPEMITDGHDGLLVESRNAAAVAGAISRLLDDDEYRRQLGTQARKTMETKFSLDTVIDSLTASFERSMADG